VTFFCVFLLGQLRELGGSSTTTGRRPLFVLPRLRPKSSAFPDTQSLRTVSGRRSAGFTSQGFRKRRRDLLLWDPCRFLATPFFGGFQVRSPHLSRKENGLMILHGPRREIYLALLRDLRPGPREAQNSIEKRHGRLLKINEAGSTLEVGKNRLRGKTSRASRRWPCQMTSRARGEPLWIPRNGHSDTGEIVRKGGMAPKPPRGGLSFRHDFGENVRKACWSPREGPRSLKT